MIFETDKARLMFGDCLELMNRVPDGSVDMILADLPYGTTMCDWDSVIPLTWHIKYAGKTYDLGKALQKGFSLAYLEQNKKPGLWENYLRVAKENSPIVLTSAQPFTSQLVMSRPDLFRYDLVWEKTHATGHLNAKRMPLRAHESVLVFYRKLPTYNPQKTTGHKRKTATKRGDKTTVYGGQSFDEVKYDSTDRYPRSVQVFASDKQKSALHPTQKPVNLGQYLIRTYSNPGDTVLDNAMGSGSFGVAAVLENRFFIGMEKDRKHFDTSCQRIAAANDNNRA